jgi:gamma-glutamyl hercynylcysteine S-oxide synthase
MLAVEKRVPVPRELMALRDLMQRMSVARRRSDELFNLVRPESLYERPIPERHRIIFYIGHLEAFDWNLLSDSALGLKMRSVRPQYDRLFAFGIDPVGGGLPDDLPSDWPSLDAVHAYVKNIRSAIDAQLEKIVGEAHATTRDGFPLHTLLNVAIEHRLMHTETLAYMLHQLPLSMKHRQPTLLNPTIAPAAQNVAYSAVAIPAGTAILGLPQDSESFGWDNEFEAHTVEVPKFEIERYKVTNHQYLDFMAAGGYETRAYWTDDDWNWRSTHSISHPAFWKREGRKKEDNRWLYLTMFDEVSLPPDWPVYVSQAEASAYARWTGKSLPTEMEWQRAAYGTVNGEARAYSWGNEIPDAAIQNHENPKRFGNFDFHGWDPTPVNAFPAGQSAFGVDDMLGNGWEWTSTVFAPFLGFKPFPFYPGYSADFFDGKHFVMKGGSARTAECMLRPSFRNWFQAHYQYVYAGFRCVSHRAA